MKFTSWENWFASKDTNAIIDQLKQELLFNHFDASITSDQLIRNIEDEDKVFFLFRENFSGSRVNIFHHLIRSGGSVTNSSVQYAFIQGINSM